MDNVYRIVLIAVFCTTVLAVDHSNFKTCAQSSFCRRCRDMEPNKSPYELNMPSLEVSTTAAHVELWNTEESVIYNLTLTALLEDKFRLEIEEANPLRERYRSTQNLNPQYINNHNMAAKLTVVKQSDEIVILKSGQNSVSLVAKPFAIHLYSDDILVASVNARGLFRFEPYKKRTPQNADESNQANDHGGNEEEPKHSATYNDPGAWEENFKSFRDSKPFGPSAVAMDVTFNGAAHAYGIPEHADQLVLRDTKGKTDPYRHYNLDVFEYELNSPMALYAAIPLMYAHGPNKTVGMFWNNPSETWIDVTSSLNSENNVMNSIVNFVSGRSDGEDGVESKVEAHFMSETGVIDVFFLMGPTPKEVMVQYISLTGSVPLPQYFAIGYHQSRWNYNDEDDVRSVSDNFDLYDMPLDVLWLDIEYTNQKKYFTWDPVRFPKPTEMQQNLTSQGRKLVVIIDPHIKREGGYFLHEQALLNNYYVNNAEGNVYEGWCWPGSSSYLDFLNPAVLNYYESLYGLNKFEGSTANLYLWNDMNEPSVFNGPEVTMPKDCIHFGGWEHRDVHNLYGFFQTLGTYTGLLMRTKQMSQDKQISPIEASMNVGLEVKRPFILTRSAFAGSQKYAAIWTGDNAAEWSHLAISIPMCLSLAISGMSFCGADVGGFFGNPDAELLTRWYQAGAFLPFYRAHSHIDTKRREPYLFPQETRLLIRAALRKRYTYLPFWYTLFYEQEKTGLPVIRPLFMEYPKENAAWPIDTTFLVGDALLVSPVTQAGATQTQVYFPGGPNEYWYDTDTYQMYPGKGKYNLPVTMSKIPVFQKGGTIIPKKERVRRSTALMHNDPFTLIVALDEKGEAVGRLYVDDGETYAYNAGAFIDVSFSFKNGVFVATQMNVQKQPVNTEAWLERIVIAGYKGSAKTAYLQAQDDGHTSIAESTLDVIEEKTSTQDRILIVRKPGVKISTQQYTITLK